MAVNQMVSRPTDEYYAQRKLLTSRAVIGGVLAIALLSLPTPYPDAFLLTISIWVIALVPQWLLARKADSAMSGAGIQLIPDCLFVALIVAFTGGIYSPFALLFGLLVLGAVAASEPLFPVILSIIASTCYLISGYLGLSGLLNMQDTLQLLLQTSAIMLVGGVMGALAMRQQRLQQSSQAVQVRHRSLQRLYAHVLDGMREGILILDDWMRIRDFNSAALELLQLTNMAGDIPLYEKIDGIEPLRLFLQKPEGSMFQCESAFGDRVLLVRVTRMQRELEASWMVTIVDISHVKDLERQLVEQEKMAALGQMASMLAHEIRNPLQTMAQAHELMSHADEASRNEISTIVQDELQRLNRLVSDMLNYARPMQPKPESHATADVLSLAVHQADPEGKYQVRWQAELEDIQVDADHLRLVLDNLLNNALRASPAKGSVEVRLEPWQQGWLLQVYDQGGGIAPEIRQRLFEPFATARSDGLGLGLATVWHVCRINHWQVEARDVPGGTCFEVRSEV